MSTNCPKCGGILTLRYESDNLRIFCDGFSVPYRKSCGYKYIYELTPNERRKQQIEMEFDDRRK